MQVKTFRAANMQQALALVRHELGPEAAVLHTREVRPRGLLRLWPTARQIEVTASNDVFVPSRMPERKQAGSDAPANSATDRVNAHGSALPSPRPPVALESGLLAEELASQIGQLKSVVSDLYRGARTSAELPQQVFHLYTELIDADVDGELARQLVEQLHQQASPEELADPACAKAALVRMVAEGMRIQGPIRVEAGRRRLVALVGPTGVGKTTTIAKLAANFRLREKRKVGLITVDTYRIAAVEQLRTYADIIDLPMQVVSTPREIPEALSRLSDLDLILMDTAGRSPKDEVKIQELKAFLSEAEADEVHLVQSSVASASALARTAEQFAAVGTTALLLTKLDESTGLGNILPLIQGSQLPLSYLTNGQNVPDDIEAANAVKLAEAILDTEM